MAKYGLTGEQVKALLLIISEAAIKGSGALMIVSLMQTLNSPIKDEEKPIE